MFDGGMTEYLSGSTAGKAFGLTHFTNEDHKQQTAAFSEKQTEKRENQAL
jgi:hypothetical protein